MREKAYRSTATTAPAPPRGPKGDKGEAGPLGPKGESGDSIFLGVLESSSSELYGAHPQGFARVHTEGDLIECSFFGWREDDILTIECWCQALSQTRTELGSILVQAQVSTDRGASWHGVSGARLHIPASARSGACSASIALSSEPIVRLYVTQYDAAGPDYGSGPEGSTLVLRCTHYRAGSFAPRARLLPPLG